MRLKNIFILIGMFFVTGAAGVHAGYLVPGLGVEGVLEIGREGNPGAVREAWNDHQGLKFKTDAGGIIVLIKCEIPDFSTDANIRVGAPAADVLRRYGAPRNEDRRGDEVLYRYPGIGFTIKNSQVISIYIFPRYKE